MLMATQNESHERTSEEQISEVTQNIGNEVNKLRGKLNVMGLQTGDFVQSMSDKLSTVMEMYNIRTGMMLENHNKQVQDLGQKVEDLELDIKHYREEIAEYKKQIKKLKGKVKAD